MTSAYWTIDPGKEWEMCPSLGPTCPLLVESRACKGGNHNTYLLRAPDAEPAPQPDPVNTPEHYRWLPVEAIEITELFNFNMGNALKYIIRADHKGKPLEDLAKARWYIERELKRRETTPPS